MRIGLTVDSLSPALTGIGRYTWELSQGLNHYAEIDDLRFFRYESWVSNPEEFLLPRRFRWRQPTWLRRYTMRPGFRGRLVHGANYFLPKRTEFGVVTVHDLSVLRFPEMHPPERVAAFEKGFTRSLERASHVVTDSHAVKQELIEQTGITPSRVSAIHLGVSENFAPIRANEGRAVVKGLLGEKADDYILCVATFEPRKRIEQAILAHARLSERCAVPPLVLVGAKGWLNDALHDLIERQTRSGILRMLGHVPERELPFLYAGSRLFLYPSIYEGFGLPPIEAMASGVPTIVSDRSCLPEVTQGAAMMVDPDDIDAFAEAIQRGLEDDNWRREAIERGLDVASGYTWDKCIENTVNVYRKVWAEYA